MEVILNKLIDLDNQAKSKILQIKQKEENIETYISETLEKEKKVIDNRFLYKRKKIQEKYDNMFKEAKNRLNEEKYKQINILREKYGKPLKIKKVFYLNEESKRKRMKF